MKGIKSSERMYKVLGSVMENEGQGVKLSPHDQTWLHRASVNVLSQA